MTERLFIALQYLLPKRLLGRVVYRLSRTQIPLLKNLLIRGFVRAFRVDISEMDEPDPCNYPSFNAFFTRELKTGARPFDPDPNVIGCPADGAVQNLGRIRAGQLLQAKGIEYRLDRLLDIEPGEAERFDGGAFLTIYLAPHNYHRVHAPSDGRVECMNFVPGELFSVNETTARHVRSLFARNERVACECIGGRADYWIVFVGAMNVASVSTAWAGEIAPGPTPQRTRYAEPDARELAKGDYCGHFNMGSTIILVYPPDTVEWEPGLSPGDLLTVGQTIGRTKDHPRPGRRELAT
ncbi:MAG: archaetidylserine decarboxylase [Gammaproteobacteria bacterium]